MYLSLPFYNMLPNTMELGQIVKEYLEELTGKAFTLKPPNDILLDGKKLCGILVEARTGNGEKFGVIGIGINVKNDYETGAKLGDEYDIKEIAKEIACRVCQYLDLLGQ